MVGLVIAAIVLSIMPLLGLYMCGKFIILSYLSKSDWSWPAFIFAILAIVILFVLWFSFSWEFPPLDETPNAAAAIWTIGAALAFVYSFVTQYAYSDGDWQDDCRKMRQIIKEASTMNEVKDWTDVKVNALRHIATYWYLLLIASPLALGAIVLAWLGVTAVGVQVLKYAHAELGAVIIFKDGNISLAGFPFQLFLNGTLGLAGGVVSFKIMQWRNRSG